MWGAGGVVMMLMLVFWGLVIAGLVLDPVARPARA